MRIVFCGDTFPSAPLLLRQRLGPGDEIVTIGGLYGTVSAADDETVTLEISPGVNARYARGAVARVITSKSAPADSAVDNADAENAIDQG